jgi:hypothetical protein
VGLTDLRREKLVQPHAQLSLARAPEGEAQAQAAGVTPHTRATHAVQPFLQLRRQALQLNRRRAELQLQASDCIMGGVARDRALPLWWGGHNPRRCPVGSHRGGWPAR